MFARPCERLAITARYRGVPMFSWYAVDRHVFLVRGGLVMWKFRRTAAVTAVVTNRCGPVRARSSGPGTQTRNIAWIRRATIADRTDEAQPRQRCDVPALLRGERPLNGYFFDVAWLWRNWEKSENGKTRCRHGALPHAILVRPRRALNAKPQKVRLL